MLGGALAFARRRSGTVALSLGAARGCARVAASSELEAPAVGALSCRAAAARARTTPTSRPEPPGSGERLPNRELGGLARGHLAHGTRQRGPDQRPMHGAFRLVYRLQVWLRGGSRGSDGCLGFVRAHAGGLVRELRA